MKTFRPVPLFLVGAISGLVGYGLGFSKKETAERVAQHKGTEVESGWSSRSRRDGPPPGSPEKLLTPGIRNLLGAEPISESSIRSVTERILSETDPVRRSVAIGLIIESMTPATATSIRQAFIDSTVNTGRRNLEEWRLMSKKFGETLGLGGFEAAKGNGGGETFVLEGWAMSDTDGALALIRTMDHETPEYAGYCAAVLTGIAKTDPDKSFQLILSNPDLPVDTRTLMMSAVQSLGMEGVTQSLQNALDRADPGVAQSPACQNIFNCLATDMLHQSWTSGRSERVLPWLEQLKGQPFLTDQVASHAAMDVALQGKIAESLDWLDRMNAGDANGVLGRDGLRSALMRDPTLLIKVDEATLGRVIAQFPPKSPAMAILADAIAPLKPEYASRLRAAASSNE